MELDKLVHQIIIDPGFEDEIEGISMSAADGDDRRIPFEEYGVRVDFRKPPDEAMIGQVTFLLANYDPDYVVPTPETKLLDALKSAGVITKAQMTAATAALEAVK